MLSLKDISKSYDSFDIIRNFNLEVEKNSFVVIVGPSGCGKSTLFDILMGITDKDTGKISLKDKKVEDLGDIAAYMQQKDLLLPWLTLFENAMLPTRFNAAPLDYMREECNSLFKSMGLEGFHEYLPGQVSGGMKKRCVLVRTLMFKREIILLDEPLSSLDAIRRYQLHSLLLSLQENFKKSILMVTHDIEEALLLADEVIVMSELPMVTKETFKIDSPKPRNVSDSSLVNAKSRIFRELHIAGS